MDILVKLKPGTTKNCKKYLIFAFYGNGLHE